MDGLVMKGELAMLAVPLGSPPAQVTHDPHPTAPVAPGGGAGIAGSLGRKCGGRPDFQSCGASQARKDCGRCVEGENTAFHNCPLEAGKPDPQGKTRGKIGADLLSR